MTLTDTPLADPPTPHIARHLSVAVARSAESEAYRGARRTRGVRGERRRAPRAGALRAAAGGRQGGSRGPKRAKLGVLVTSGHEKTPEILVPRVCERLLYFLV